jgi:hypothetical protein
LKDPSLNLGRGITVLPRHFSDAAFVMSKLRQGFLLQEGVEDPVLLGDYKFTFRLYMFVQTVDDRTARECNNSSSSSSSSGSGSGRRHECDSDTSDHRPVDVFLSTDGNTAASHSPFTQANTEKDRSSDLSTADVEYDNETLASLVTNQCSQVKTHCGKKLEGCPEHSVLPLRHRLWSEAQAMLEQQYGTEVFNREEVRETIKRYLYL